MPQEDRTTAEKAGDGGIEIGPGVFAPADALRFQYARSGGPGGQNVNKLNTKVELWVVVSMLRGLRFDARERLNAIAGKRLTKEGEIHITAETARTQESNRAAVMERLREMLVRAMHRPKTRRKTRPTRSSIERRLTAKKKRSEVKAQRRAE